MDKYPKECRENKKLILGDNSFNYSLIKSFWEQEVLEATILMIESHKSGFNADYLIEIIMPN